MQTRVRQSPRLLVFDLDVSCPYLEPLRGGNVPPIHNLKQTLHNSY